MRQPSPAATSPYQQAAAPINLLNKASTPPTPRGVPSGKAGTGGPGKTTNTRGMNRKLGGKVNTNISTSGNSSIESKLLNRAFNIQK